MSGRNIFESIVRALDNLTNSVIDNFRYFAVIFILFLVGFAVGALAYMPKESLQIQEASGSADKSTLASLLPFNSVADEKPSPLERIKEDQIHVYKDKIIIELENAEWATFTDTNSMDPIIDFGAYAIEVVPESEKNITLGDIISYNSEYASGTIIHRVVEINEDENGWFCRTKGDNNSDVDPGKIRFSQIQRVVVAIIY